MRRASAICALLILCSMCAGQALAPSYDWTSSKIRGAYFYSGCGPGHFKALADNGFNCGMAKLGLDPADPSADEARLKAIAGLAKGAADAGVKFMPVLNWAGHPEARFLAKDGRRFVSVDGRRLEKTPCPNDPRHWKHVVQARFEAIGDLGMREAIAGALFDPEMYGADIGGYPASGCYCDDCWAQFVADTRVDAPADLPAKDRAKWLRDNGKDALYLAHQEQALVAILRDLREAVHKEHPDLMLGFLNYRSGPFYRGLVRGLGTPERPVLIFPETTYATGYSVAQVDNVAAEVRRIGAHAIFVPGLWISKWYPDDLAAQAYHCAKHSGGYWLFTTYSFTKPRDELKSDYRIPADADEYWKGLKLANTELDKLAADPEYESPLKIGERKTVFLPLVVGKIEIPALQPLSDTPPEGFKGLPASRLRGRGVVYLLSPGGGEVGLRISCIRLGRYADAVGWAVVGPDNEELAAGNVGLNKTEETKVELPAGQVCALVVSAGSNTFSVNASDCYEAFPTRLRLCGRIAPSLYFYVPPAVESFTVRVSTGAEAETVKCDVVSPMGEIVAAIAGGFPTTREMEIKVTPADRGKIWRLVMGKAPTGVFEDVGLSFSKEIPPYVAEAPDRLLIPADLSD